MANRQPQTTPNLNPNLTSPRRNTHPYTYDTYATFETTLEQQRNYIVEEMFGSATMMPPRKFQTTFMPIPRKGARGYKSRPNPKSFDAVAALSSEKALSANWVSGYPSDAPRCG